MGWKPRRCRRDLIGDAVNQRTALDHDRTVREIAVDDGSEDVLVIGPDLVADAAV
jgi:hypothetical protein